MSDFTINNILKDGEVSSSKTNLWVWHADKIPPHVGLSVDNLYFSLKANGKDENVDLKSINSILSKKPIATLCFELDKEVSSEKIRGVFNSFSTTIPGEVTCLNPIKSLIGCQGSTKLIELLEELYSTKSVSRVVGFNIPKDFGGIKNYSIGDIHNRLTKLSNGK